MLELGDSRVSQVAVIRVLPSQHLHGLLESFLQV